MKEDNILDGIKFDYAIFLWLNAEALKYKTVPHRHNKVRSDLRSLARLLHHMKILNYLIQEFGDIFHETLYGNFIDALRTCGILENSDRMTYNRTSAARVIDMCYLIKNVGNVYRITLRDIHKQQEIVVFLRKVDVLRHSTIAQMEMFKNTEP